MAQKLYSEEAINDIGAAIQEQLDTTDQFLVSEMGDAIRSISGGGGNSMIAEAYNTTTEYATGDYCIYNKQLYICTGDTTGPFDNTKWTTITITEDLKSLHTQLNSIECLPSVTSEDEGKVLKVDNSGNWVAGDDEQATVTANPVGSATQDLTKLQVGNTIYGIPNELPSVTSEDVGKVLTVDENGHWIPFDAAPAEDWGDITYDKEIIDSWDFTQSLTGKNGNTFVITAGATRTSSGIVFDNSIPSVTCDLKNVVDDWTNVGIRMICTGTFANNIALWGCTNSVLFEIENTAPYNQIFPRDFYTPNIPQLLMFRDFAVDNENGFYYYNHLLASSTSTVTLFSLMNTGIRDGNEKFCIGPYSNYKLPPSGFTVTGLQIWKKVVTE